ncbi:MFS transporter [Lampropedia aestuarii]|uniref:MFS transporter n=1 Tax=Lampropedia aestuarii TaxID=2562762 RepID=A0A4S5BIP5_9BURK|nr:MFS transporter [Lampropedia aestuarii]THJ30665.1 MFS transporter [Lampropedia aestuarii]
MTNQTHQGHSRGKSLRAAAIGNALEWFDWTLYGIFSVYLARNLFDKADPRSALLSTLAVFAVGFIARPVGGFVFGKLGDRYGRKAVLVTTMILLAICSAGIGLIPSYSSIGIGASILLVILRLLQGLAHGGETGVSYTYVAEIAPKEKRGLWSSTVFISVTLGVMAATATAATLTSMLGKEAMDDYGWRIGFYIGGILGIYALFLRRSAQESQVFEHKKAAPAKPLTKREILIIARNIIMLSAASNVTYYTWVTFAPSTAIAKGMDASGAYWASLAAQVLCLIWLPVCGWMADKFGRKPIVFAWGLAVIVLSYPISAMVTQEPMTLFFAQVLGLGAWALIASIYPAIVSEQVPTQARAQGVGFVSSLSVAIFGGTAPYINTYLAGSGYEFLYIGYLMCLGLMAIIASIIIKETARIDLADIR